jgi:hypothetical protein
MESKPRLILITDHLELAALQTGQDSLGVPHLVAGQGGWYANPDELRVWRALKAAADSRDQL